MQAVTKGVIFHIITELYHKTKIDILCLAGGVAQNSVANGKIIANTPMKHLYFPIAGHDAGISMGAAYYANHQLLGGERQSPIFSAYTGLSFTNEEVQAVLKKNEVKYQVLDNTDIYEIVSEKLIEGGVVG